MHGGVPETARCARTRPGAARACAAPGPPRSPTHSREGQRQSIGPGRVSVSVSAGMNFILPTWPDPDTPLNDGLAFDKARCGGPGARFGAGGVSSSALRFRRTAGAGRGTDPSLGQPPAGGLGGRGHLRCALVPHRVVRKAGEITALRRVGKGRARLNSGKGGPGSSSSWWNRAPAQLDDTGRLRLRHCAYRLHSRIARNSNRELQLCIIRSYLIHKSSLW